MRAKRHVCHAAAGIAVLINRYIAVEYFVREGLIVERLHQTTMESFPCTKGIAREGIKVFLQ